MDDTIRNCLILIPALPLAAPVLIAVLGPRVLRGLSHWPLLIALLGSFIGSLILMREVGDGQRSVRAGGYEQVVTLWNWVDVGTAYDLKANRPAVEPADAGWRSL